MNLESCISLNYVSELLYKELVKLAEMRRSFFYEKLLENENICTG